MANEQKNSEKAGINNSYAAANGLSGLIDSVALNTRELLGLGADGDVKTKLEQNKANKGSNAKTYASNLIAQADDKRVTDALKDVNFRSADGLGKVNLGSEPLQNDPVANVVSAGTLGGHTRTARDISNDSVNRFETLLKMSRAKDKNSLINGLLGRDFSKTGRFGNLNNMSFDDTLAASREADAINNVNRVPINYMLSAGGVIGQGVHFDKVSGNLTGDITTQEMRQMRANEELNRTQRADDIRLQTAINNLDYDMFKNIFESETGIITNAEQNALAFATVADNLKLSNFYQKNIDVFKRDLALSTAGKYTNVMVDLLNNGSTIEASMLSGWIGGNIPPSNQQMAESIITKSILKYADEHGISKENAYQMVDGVLTAKAVNANNNMANGTGGGI